MDEPAAALPRRRPDAAWERWWRALHLPLLPRRDALLDHATLMLRGEQRMAQQRPPETTLLLFGFEELRELRPLFGERVRRLAVREVASGLRRFAGPRGLAGRTGQAQFTVVLGTGRQRAIELAHGALGEPCRFEVEATGDELVLVPDVVAEQCGPGAGAFTRLHERMAQLLREHQRARREHQRHLRRSRERYVSAPRPLPSR